MITLENKVTDTVIKKLKNYNIKNDLYLKETMHEIILDLLDNYIQDLYNSVELLFNFNYLNDINCTNIEAIKNSQYHYYQDIIDNNMVEIYKKIQLEEVV